MNVGGYARLDLLRLCPLGCEPVTHTEFDPSQPTLFENEDISDLGINTQRIEGSPDAILSSQPPYGIHRQQEVAA
jgi:hypothetical protein